MSDQEQVAFVLEGEARALTPGAVAHIPPHVPHAARTRETGCRQVDVFSPPRRVLLEQMSDAG